MNIGACARAMRNMGIGELALVAPHVSPLHPDAILLGVHARELLERARVFPTLLEAVADCTWVVGTTRRGGKGRRGVVTPRQMAAELAEIIGQNRVALVFGPEDRGLSNRDLDLCQRLVTIPADEHYGSLNLAQAVMILLYEISLACKEGTRAPKEKTLATAEELEGMYRQMEELLLRIGFLHKENPKRIMTVLRRILGRAMLEPREVRVVRGILRQALWFARRVDPHKGL